VPDRIFADHRLIDLPLQQNTQASAKLADLVITPNLDGYGSADFVKGLEMVPLGYRAALQDQDKLRQWSASEGDFAAWKARHDVALPQPSPIIRRIEVDATAAVDSRRIKDMIRTKAGQPLDNKVLADDLTRIYGLGIFETVRYTLEPDGDSYALHISAAPKSWGPTYMGVGLNMATDFGATTEFGLTAMVDATELNRLGGQWKTRAVIGSPVDFETRFFQPLNYAGRLYVSPYAGWQQYKVQFWNPQGTVATNTAQFKRPFGGIDVGYDFGNFAELRVGYVRSSRDGESLVGVPLNWSGEQGALTAQLMIDRLDNVNLPQSGYFARITYEADRTEYGASTEYDLLSVKAGAAATFGRWTGNVRLEYGSSLGTTVPPFERFTLGGLFRLSGRPIRNLRGQELALATGQVYYRLAGTGEGFIKNVSVGGSLETGNAWANRDVAANQDHDLESAGSVFVITDTMVGPFFLGYGRSGDFDSYYLYLNRSF
jgi:NTE family protein